MAATTTTAAPAAADTTAEAPGFRGAGSGKIGIWVFLASDLMGFGAMLLAYALSRTGARAWPDPAARLDRPLAAALTLLLLASGVTMALAVSAARAERWRRAALLVGVTALAGLLFVSGQAAEYLTLARGHGVGLAADQAASLFYVVTGFHGAHVLAGVALLVLLAARLGAGGAALRGRLEVVALYWQLVDAVWLVLFAAIYLAPAGRPLLAAAVVALALAGLGAILVVSMGLRREGWGLRLMALVPLVLCVALVVALVLDTQHRAQVPGWR
jgi:heme/copper-type cytochrome/quinol oxidase subunit 3